VIPLVKSLDEHGDVEALAALYSNVCFFHSSANIWFERGFKLRKGSDKARGDDAGNLKSAVVTWVNDLYGLSTRHLELISKTERGLENDHTGRLICPAEFDWDDTKWEYSIDYNLFTGSLLYTLSVCANIRDGHIDYTVTAQSWPKFCYAGLSCNTEDVEQGLFRSTLLVKVVGILPCTQLQLDRIYLS